MSVTAGYKVDQRFVFYAVSSDILPTQWSGQPIPVGSDLYFTDTNQHMVWTGPTAGWDNFSEEVEENPVYNPLLYGINDTTTQVVSLLAEILGQLKLLNAASGQDPSSAPIDLNTNVPTFTQ